MTTPQHGGRQHSHADKHSLENCRDCEYRRQIAVLDSLPESVVQGKSGDLVVNH